jgi:hypothetical protein
VGGQAGGWGPTVSERKKKEKKGRGRVGPAARLDGPRRLAGLHARGREGRWPDRLQAEKKKRRRWAGEERRPAGLEKREGEEGRFWEFFKKTFSHSFSNF